MNLSVRWENLHRDMNKMAPHMSPATLAHVDQIFAEGAVLMHKQGPMTRAEAMLLVDLARQVVNVIVNTMMTDL